jgi:DNA-binding Lrp family transcriptional regulator
MKERGFYAGTMALINYQKLDLAYVPVLVQAPIGSLNTLFRVVRVHPYIHYSVRTLGSTDGAFLVFIQPQNAMPSLIEFLDQLASRGVITGYRFFVNAGSKRSFPTADLRLFNPRTNNWDFDWGTWRAAEEKNESASDGGRIETVTVEPELHNLDKCDIELLRILTEDAQAATENIAKGAHLLPHEVRGRIKRLEEEAFVVGYRAMITYSKFHLSSTILFDCNARANEVELCRKKLLTLPFPGTFIPVQNGFLCQMTMPSEGLPPVQEFLARYCNNVAVSWYDLPTSDVAAFNAGSYADGAWRVDSGYVLEEPLKLITKEANP